MGALLESGMVGNIGLKHLRVIKEDVDKIQKILKYYFFGPPIVTKEEKKVDGIVVKNAHGKPILH